MIEPYRSILLIVLAGYFDFSRGGHGQWTRKIIPFISHKHIFLFLLASLYVYAVGFTYWASLFVVWFTIAGVAFGTGDPVGKIVGGHAVHGNDDNKANKNEKWQIFGTENAFMNHAILGCLWAVPALPLYYINELWPVVFFAHAVGFYVAGFIARLFDPTDRWSTLEALRSGLAMTLTVSCLEIMI